MPASEPVDVEDPRQRVDGMQVDAALGGQQRILPAARMRTPQRPKRRTPAGCRSDESRASHHQRGAQRDAGAAGQRDGKIGDLQVATPDLLLRRPAPAR